MIQTSGLSMWEFFSFFFLEHGLKIMIISIKQGFLFSIFLFIFYLFSGTIFFFFETGTVFFFLILQTILQFVNVVPRVIFFFNITNMPTVRECSILCHIFI